MMTELEVTYPQRGPQHDLHEPPSSLSLPVDQNSGLRSTYEHAGDNAYNEDGMDETFDEANSPEALQARHLNNEFDEEDSDWDSAIEDDTESLWTSLKSDALDFRFENGRRYHSYREGRYFHPNDEQEINREDMKHHATMLLYKGKLHHAPIGSHPHKILDVGTGTGIWAMDTADHYPSAEVIGVDLSPIQPQMTPPNLNFEIDDLESDWLWPDNSFDLVHIRYMFSAIQDWPRLLTQARAALKPGGWVEITEMDIVPTSDDGTVTSDYRLLQYFDILKRAARGKGFNLSVAPDIKGLVTSAGYHSVTETVYKLPMGPWPADRELRMVGLYHREQFLAGLQGIIIKYLTAVEGWQPKDIEELLGSVREQIMDKNIHCYWKIYNVYAQKAAL